MSHMGAIASRAFRFLGVVAAVGAAMAAAPSDLYEARTIVTGQAVESRMRGFAECLADVLVKVSGDPRLSGDPGMTALASEAGAFVAEFGYRSPPGGTER